MPTLKYDPCLVQAGSDVDWDGQLTPSQCEAFPVGGEYGNRIGRGSFAAAYEHRDDPTKVVKFTADMADAAASALVAEKPLAGTVRIFDVARLTGQEAEAPVMVPGGFKTEKGRPVYGIIAEKLDDLTDVQRDVIYSFWGQLKNRTSELELKDPKRFDVNDYADFRTVFEACRAKHDSQAAECWDTAGDIFNAVKEQAQEIGVIPLDLPARNWGSRDGKPVILDLGVSARATKDTNIRQLAGRKKNMSKRPRKASRPHVYDYTFGAFEIPEAKAAGSFASSLLPRALAIGGLGALVYWFFFSAKAAAKENVKSAALPTGSETGGSVTAERGSKPATFIDPGSNVAIAGPSDPIVLSNDRYVIKTDESWSNVASRVYGDYRWWPALWDFNRASGRFGNPNTVAVGDVIVVPKLPVQSERFKKLVFDRAEVDRKWEVTKRTKGAKAAGSRPKSTFAATPVLATDFPAAAAPTAPVAQPALPAAPVKEVDYVTTGPMSAEPEGGYEDLSS